MSRHETKFGTYHSSRPGPSCDGEDCAHPCDCEDCEDCGHWGHEDVPCECCEAHECCGLSFVYVCLDGGESYCQDCFEKLEREYRSFGSSPAEPLRATNSRGETEGESIL